MKLSLSAKVFTKILAAIMLVASLPIAFAQDAFLQNTKRFDYEATAPLDIKEISAETRDAVTIHEITYASPKGGVVPATLVAPSGTGKFAALVWGHWMMKNSPTANRKEFLDEAIALAPTGVISILIDTPQIRPGFKPGQGSPNAQQVVDLRRAVDLLLARADVDPKRIAYVGHSFDAGTGAILDAVDKRFAAFVFMGGPMSIRQYVLFGDTPDINSYRKTVSPEKLHQTLHDVAWTDPENYATHFGPAPALFQYAEHDDFVPLNDAKDFFASASGPKEAKYYDSTHTLNADARRDRVAFLCDHLNLPSLPPEALQSIPQIAQAPLLQVRSR